VALRRRPDGAWMLSAEISAAEFREFAEHWQLRDDAACAALSLGGLVQSSHRGLEIWIISGGRTCSRQREFGRQGRPVAACNLSTHVLNGRLATGFDIAYGPDTLEMKGLVGNLSRCLGIRWGGGSETDPSTQMPTDVNHFDLGPRSVTG